MVNANNDVTKTMDHKVNHSPTNETGIVGKQKVKFVVIGDGGCGKTSLLVVYVDGEFPEEYVPTVFENYTTEMLNDGKKFTVTLWDTAGQEDYDRLRPLSYDKTDVIILCYDITSRPSFENVDIRWLPELRHFCASVPIVLVACKTDLRIDPNRNDTADDVINASNQSLDVGETHKGKKSKIVTTAEGERLAKSIKASAFVECSAKLNENINQVFLLALQTLDPPPPANICPCSLL